MTEIDIIGSGHMARGIATRLLAGRHDVRIIGRNDSQMRDLIESLGPGASGAYMGSPITSNVVILAVPHGATREVLLEYGDGFDGKVVVDISNPVDYTTMDRLTTSPGSSAAEETATMLEGRAEVVKAFNTTFPKTLVVGTVAGQPLDVFIAGDSEAAKEKVSAAVARSGMRPIDVGPLRWARELEAFMLLIMALQVNPEHEHFNWDTALKLLA
ncbi:NADPH-dependent F420 reductase [Arthrobacter sulfonylureivorans]|uniref:NAD(P)-binding domain-containing protein n=1 Tax=Arthrobacter sulfonylureivorans TaxID=2486855 RepID=A0ABY3W550_9MICC|nr:NAD(P)-binding domain-containing protein [Arthrobacter sulfonylureivorans]UNK44270.1 NAD(P)-binding domain-containing protein [Arthrobacter sulfonylureivorans]